MSQVLQIESTQRENSLIISITGEATYETCEQMSKSLHQLIAENQCHVIIDLSDLTFITSSAIGVLIDIHNRLTEKKCTLILVGIHDAISDVFRTARLERVFQIAPDVDTALAG